MRLALKIVIQNDGDLVNVTLLYMLSRSIATLVLYKKWAFIAQRRKLFLKFFVVKYLITCYYIAEADGGEGDEGVVETFDEAPAFKVHESERGQDEEDHEARYQI